MDHLLPVPTSSLRPASRSSAAVATADRGVGGARDGFGAAMRQAMRRDDRADLADRGRARAADRGDRADRAARAERGLDRADDRAAAPADRGSDHARERGAAHERADGARRVARPAAGFEDDPRLRAEDTDDAVGRAIEELLTALDGDPDGARSRAPRWPLTLLADALAEAAAEVTAGAAGAALGTASAVAASVSAVEDPEVTAALEQALVPERLAGGEDGDALAAAAELLTELVGTLPADAGADTTTEDGQSAWATSGRDRTATDGNVVADLAGTTARATDTRTGEADAEVATPRLRDGLPLRSDAGADRANAATRVPGADASSELGTNAGFRAVGLSGDGPQGLDQPRAESVRLPSLPAGVQRVLDLVSQLEKMPPPRQLVLELGDLRVRVGMEDGQVRLTVLAGDQQDADELLADARDALAQQGFDLSEERDDAPDQGASSGSDDPAPAPEPPSARARRSPAGLRL